MRPGVPDSQLHRVSPDPDVQPTGELVVDLKTVAARDLEPSPSLLLSANEVIR